MAAHTDAVDPHVTRAPPGDDGDDTLFHPGPEFAGERLERYTIQGELGRGGMGVVYQAHDPRMNRKVAIKQLLGERGSDAEVARFRREAQSIARMQHPNIVRVYDIDEEDGSWFMVLDFVEGESLQDRLKAQGPFELEEAVRITVEIAVGLDYAHSRSILHRDIKPANVLLTPDGEVKITDFGLAKVLSLRDEEATLSLDRVELSEQALRDGRSLTLDGCVVGTPTYMPPEQADGGNVDARSDVYALGATLYALLTGRPPIVGKSIMAILKAIFLSPATSTRRTLNRTTRGVSPGSPA